ncbi:MAG: TlpA family protein disulfide reductase [Phycisphaerae bacterium]|nr:TlpA family protein disulfide reductase [Phycisphaerae bacterium]
MRHAGFVVASGLVLASSHTLIAQDAPKAKPAGPAPAKAEQPAEPAAAISLGDEKDPAKIMEKAKAAALAVKDIACTVEASMGAADHGTDAKPADKQSIKGKVLVAFKKGGPFPLGNWRIERLAKTGDDKPHPIIAFDGENMLALDHDKKEIRQTPPAMGFAFPEGEESLLLPMWFFEQRQDMLAMMGPKVTEQVLVGEEDIGGVKCAVVRTVREATLPDMGDGDDEDAPAKDADKPKGEKPARKIIESTVVALGRADALPRRVERSMKVIGGDDEGGEQSIIQTFADVKTNTNPPAAAYGIKTPDGYAVRKVEAGEDSGPALKFKVGDAAPAFALKDAEGKEHTLAGLKGKIVLLDFWATWCGPCKAAMPAIQKIHEQFAGKPVAVLGVNTWERKADAGPAYMAKQKFTYPCLLAGDELATTYGISGIPTLVLIDGDGKILHIGVGFGPGEEKHLTEIIEGALAKK